MAKRKAMLEKQKQLNPDGTAGDVGPTPGGKGDLQAPDAHNADIPAGAAAWLIRFHRWHLQAVPQLGPSRWRFKLAIAETGIRYKNRPDVLLATFPKGTSGCRQLHHLQIALGTG